MNTRVVFAFVLLLGTWSASPAQYLIGEEGFCHPVTSAPQTSASHPGSNVSGISLNYQGLFANHNGGQGIWVYTNYTGSTNDYAARLVDNMMPVPEPSSAVLAGLGGAAMLLLFYRRRKPHG